MATADTRPGLPAERRAGHRAGGDTRRRPNLPSAALHAATLLAIVAMTLIVSLPFLRGGGMFLDDWWVRAETLYGDSPDRVGFWQGLSNLGDITGFRPTLVPMLAVLVHLTGGHGTAYALFAAAMGVLVAAALYGALRVARVPWLPATCAALLLTAVPWAGSTRFWANGSVINFACALTLAGLATGALALRPGARRRAALLAASSIALVVAVLMYEVTAGLVGVGLLYYAAATRSLSRRVVAKWVADVALILVALLVFRTTGRTDAAPADTYVEHARTFVRESWWYVSAAAMPDGTWGTVYQLVAAALAVVLVVRLARFRPAILRDLRGPGGARVLRAAAWALGAGAAGLAGYVLYVPADAWYHPAQPGQGDRVNGVAAIGFATALIAISWTFAAIAALGARRPGRWLAATGTVLSLLVVGGVAGQTRAEGRLYVRANELQQATLAGIRNVIRRPPPHGSTLLSFGVPGYAGPNLPAFGDTWDLDGAVRLALGDGTLHAYPILEGQAVACGKRTVDLPVNPGRPPLYGPRYSSPYGRTIFLDAAQGRSTTIDDPRECAAALATYRPGPYMADAGG